MGDLAGSQYGGIANNPIVRTEGCFTWRVTDRLHHWCNHQLALFCRVDGDMRFPGTVRSRSYGVGNIPTLRLSGVRTWSGGFAVNRGSDRKNYNPLVGFRCVELARDHNEPKGALLAY